LENVFDVQEMRLKIKDLEALTLKNDFWNDQDKARAVLQKKTNLEGRLDRWEGFNQQINDIENLSIMASQERMKMFFKT